MEQGFRVGDWRVQPDFGTLTRGEEQVQVEPKAMAVLVYLAEHAGELVPKERLIRAVWPDTFVGDDVLAHAISVLRKAFGEDAINSTHIRTLPRRGYQLIAEVEFAEEAGPEPGPSRSRLVQRTDLAEPVAQVISGPRRPTAPAGQRSAWLTASAAVVGLVLVALVAYWGWGLWRQTEPAPEPNRKSIAVLPLDNLSAEPDSDYFSDGLTDDIILQLSKIGNLKVIARTSVMRYKDPENRDLPQIARELGVATILEGSVRRADGRVRVVARLIDPETVEHLWAETYDRDLTLTDIFAIQSDVSEQIAGALKAELSPEAKVRIEKRPTENLEAYNSYLKGRFFRWKYPESSENELKAIDHFLDATEKDPSFALAYAEFAECYNMLARNSFGSWEKAESAVEQALKLDANLPEAHVARGQHRLLRYFDWVGAEEAFKRALELDPNHWNAHRHYGLLLARMGRYAEALVERKQLHQLDPVAPMSNSHLAGSYMLMGDFDQVIEIYQKMVELYPEQDIWHRRLAVVYAEKGLFDEALEELAKVRPPNRTARGYLMEVGYIHALIRNRAEAQKYVERLESLELRADRKNLSIAKICVGLGDYEEALRRLEQAWVEGFGWPNLKTWYWTGPLRDDPRFEKLLRRTNLEP